MKRTRKILRASRSNQHPYASSRCPSVTEKCGFEAEVLPSSHMTCCGIDCTITGCERCLQEERMCDQCKLRSNLCECPLNLSAKVKSEVRSTDTSPCRGASPSNKLCAADCGYESAHSLQQSPVAVDCGYESADGQQLSPNAVDSSALFNAALQRDIEATNELLLRYQANPLLKNGEVLSPLYFAAKSGNSNIVKQLVAHGFDVNEEIHNVGKGARCRHLHLAVARNDVPMVHTLLECGADPNARDSSGRTSLHVAAYLGLADLVPILLDSGAQIHLLDDQGLTAAYLAVWFGHFAAYRRLAQGNSDPNQRGPDGTSLLQLAIRNHDLDLTKLLLALGSDVNSCSNSGATPLHSAILAGNWTAADWLLKLGAKHETRLERGKAPLHLAAESRAQLGVSILLRHGANPDVVDDEGNSPLLIAAGLGCLGTVNELLKYGADPSLRDARGSNSLHVAAEKGFIHLLAPLLGKGVDINAVDGQGRTALHIATANEFEMLLTKCSFANYLLSYGADPNPRLPSNGETALHMASRRGLVNLVGSLLRFEADVDAVSKNGQTALGLAIRYQHPACVDCLLGFGADPELRGVGAWAFDNCACPEALVLLARVYVKLNAAGIPIESSLLRKAESLVCAKIKQSSDAEVTIMKSSSLKGDLRVLDVLRAPKRALSSMVQLAELDQFFRSPVQAGRFPEYRGLLFGQWLRGRRLAPWYQRASDALRTMTRCGMDLPAVDGVLGHLDADDIRNLALSAASTTSDE